jgi:DNA-binding CsgD family transcriptional regulator
VRRDYLSIVEAAYSPAPSDFDWVEQVATAAWPSLDLGLGLNVYTYDARDPGDFRVPACASRGVTPMDRSAIEALVRAGSPDLIRMAYTPGPPMFHSQLAPALHEAGASDAMAPHDLMATYGFRDVLAVRGCDLSMRGCLLTCNSVSKGRISNARLRLLGCLSAHLASGWRLRQVRASTPTLSDLEGADAVLDARGRLLHAQTSDAKTHRGGIEAECDRRLCALGPLRRLDQDAAVAAWRAMLYGEWTLVNHVDIDGKRFFLAVRNRPRVGALGGLTVRQSQVARYAACGMSLKSISYELGLSAASVQEHLKTALRKLRLKDRSELAAFVRAHADETERSA